MITETDAGGAAATSSFWVVVVSSPRRSFWMVLVGLLLLFWQCGFPVLLLVGGAAFSSSIWVVVKIVMIFYIMLEVNKDKKREEFHTSGKGEAIPNKGRGKSSGEDQAAPLNRREEGKKAPPERRDDKAAPSKRRQKLKKTKLPAQKVRGRKTAPPKRTKE